MPCASADPVQNIRANILSIEAISKKEFWFKFKAALDFNPQAY